MKLQPLAFGIAFGLVWAFGVFFAGIFAMFGWGNAFVATIGSFYLGYGASIRRRDHRRGLGLRRRLLRRLRHCVGL